MTRSLTMAALAMAALVCAGVLSQTPAVAQPTRLEQPPCLTQARIHDYQLVPGNRSLIVVDTARRRYRLNFNATCYNIQYEFGLRFKTRGIGTLSCVDRGDSVLLREGAGAGQCFVRDIQYQTPAMDRADYEAAQAAKHR